MFLRNCFVVGVLATNYLFAACSNLSGDNGSSQVCALVESAMSGSLFSDEFKYSQLRSYKIEEPMQELSNRIKEYWLLTEELNTIHARINNTRLGISLANKNIANNVKFESELEELKSALYSLNTEIGLIDAELESSSYADLTKLD